MRAQNLPVRSPASQMVTNQPLAATLWVKRGYRDRKVDTKTQTTESQTQVDQRIQAKMDTSQTHISALEIQVAASVQALADDYLAQFSLEPTTRTRVLGANTRDPTHDKVMREKA